MSETKFQNLVDLRESDYKKTYEYVNKNFALIEKFRKQFVDYLGCNSRNVIFVGFPLENGVPQKDGYWRNLIQIDDECFFEFRLQVNLHGADESFVGFNVNDCGQDFLDKNLVPPLGLIFALGVKHESEKCVVKFLNSPKHPAEKEFTINLEEAEPFSEIFEFLYEDMKKAMEFGLEGRIDRLKCQEYEAEKRLGFSVPTS